jgi:hypothetical protein
VDNKVWQEFYCNDCVGYFRVKLNLAINARVEMVCPNCGRKHPRVIKDGVIYEHHAGLGPNAWTEEIIVPKSAWSKESQHTKMIVGARDGVVFKGDDYKGDPLLRELWLERHGGDGNND